MKIVTFCLSISFLVFACTKKEAQTTTETTPTVVENATEQPSYARILFEHTTYDFGKIKQGEVIKHTFVFKNDGKNPLIVSNAQASCGCTVPEWPKEAIKPGESGKIEVQFNSTGKSGIQNKTVIITANTLPNTTTLVLNGEVEAPKK